MQRSRIKILGFIANIDWTMLRERTRHQGGPFHPGWYLDLQIVQHGRRYVDQLRIRRDLSLVVSIREKEDQRYLGAKIPALCMVGTVYHERVVQYPFTLKQVHHFSEILIGLPDGIVERSIRLIAFAGIGRQGKIPCLWMPLATMGTHQVDMDKKRLAHIFNKAEYVRHTFIVGNNPAGTFSRRRDPRIMVRHPLQKEQLLYTFLKPAVRTLGKLTGSL